MNMTLNPTLKPSFWLFHAHTNGLIHHPLFSGEGAPEAASQLYIAYAVDMGDNIGCLTKDTYPELTIDQIHQHAQSELRNHLASIDWQIHSHPANQKSYRIAYFEGDYYAAEVILLKERMQELHSLLKAKHILASMPARGLLVAIPFDEEDADFLEVFLSIVYEQYESSPVDEKLSDAVWAVVDGEVGGTLEVNQAYRDWHSQKVAVELNGSSTECSDTPRTIPVKETTLYSPAQLAVAGFIGTPFAGLLAISLNFFSLGERKKSAIMLMISVLALCGLIGLYIYVPRTDYDRLVPGVTALLVAVIGKLLFFRHSDENAQVKRQSMLKLFGVIVVGLIVSFSVLVLAGILMEG